MKTKTINLYNFDELTKEQQKKAIDNLRNINTDGDYWFEDIIREWKEKLTRQGFLSPEIYFSGFCSQGDGASFKAEVDIEKFLKGRRMATKYKEAITNYQEGESSAEITTSGRYCHEYTMTIDGYNTPDELDSLILDHAREQARKIYKELEKEYFYLSSDESIIDTIKANEYTFNEQGMIEN